MGYLNNLYKIYTGIVSGDKTGTPAKTAGQGINNNMDALDNALEAINTASEKTANKVTTLDAANNTTFPTTQTVKGYVDGKEIAANNYTLSQLGSYQAKAEKGQPNGYMGLDANGIALAANLPVSVDEIIEGAYINATTFNDTVGNPVTPAKAKIYMDIAVNPVKQYRWGGSAFGEINPNVGTSDELPEGNVNLFFTGARVLATVLAGLDTLTALAVNSGDSMLVAIGKLQAQFNTIATSIGNKLDKGSYNDTAQDLKTAIDAKETPLGAQSKADQAETRAKAYADGLLKQGVAGHYADIATMIADQANQDTNGIYFVTDASQDPSVISGFAYYEYLGTLAGDLTDYRKLSEEESMDVGGGVTQQYVNDEDAAVLASAVARVNHTGTQAPSTIVQDANNRFTTDAEKTAWNNKANLRLDNVAADLNTTEKDAIKAKLGITAGAAVEPAQVTKTTAASFDSETLSDGNYSQNGKNVLVQNGVNAINITVGATANFVASYQKEGTGAITFLASAGKTLRKVDATEILNGAVGSTATVSVVGTIVSLRISNAV